MTSAGRAAIQYGLLFAATGVSLPFASVWLAAHGLDGAEIAVILATPMLARLVTGPAVAIWADGFRHRRTAVALLGLASALGYATAGLVEGFALWLPAWFVGATAASSMLPLIDTLSLRLARRDGFAFAAVRSAGSIAFVAANVGIGALLVRAPVDVILVAIVAAVAVSAAFAAFALPLEAVEARAPAAQRFAGLGRLIGDRAFMTAILATGLVQASHAFQYGFSVLVWSGQGISERLSGMLWGFGVVCEIGFMLAVEPWRRRRGVGPGMMLIIGAAAAVVRWLAMAVGPPEWLLWPLQALHALTFAATFLAGVEAVERLCPPEHHTAGQMLSSTLSAGVLIGLATIVSGPLYDGYGAGGYAAMTILAALGGLAAWRTGRTLGYGWAGNSVGESAAGVCPGCRRECAVICRTTGTFQSGHRLRVRRAVHEATEAAFENGRCSRHTCCNRYKPAQ